MNSADEMRVSSNESETMRYRPNVAAIVQQQDGRILICERIDMPGAWQFPQGGVEPGETHREALEREMLEELSLASNDYEVMQDKGPYRYVIGNGKTKKGYHGQEQRYFLLRLLAPENRINVVTPEQEFSSWRWIEPGCFQLRWLPPMKYDVYRQVIKDFFGIDIENGGMR